MNITLALMTALMMTGSRQLRFGEALLPSGLRLSYAEQGDPRGPALLLLHGYSDSWFSFSRILPLLDPGYHVYALDLRGHGSSDRPSDGYAMGDLAADVLGFMDERKLDRATLVGHSMGSLVAQQLAARAPHRVSRLVLIGSVAAPGRSSGLQQIAAAIQPLGDTVPEEFIREFQLSSVYRPLPADFMQQVIAESRELPIRVWRGIIEGMLAMEPATALGTSGIPTLVLWGERDALFGREDQRELLQLIGAAELVVYPQTGHTPHWERPEEVAADLHAFLGRTASP
jgi:pimeloyl-ACP methyl ester carboxylesterase